MIKTGFRSLAVSVEPEEYVLIEPVSSISVLDGDKGLLGEASLILGGGILRGSIGDAGL